MIYHEILSRGTMTRAVRSLSSKSFGTLSGNSGYLKARLRSFPFVSQHIPSHDPLSQIKITAGHFLHSGKPRYRSVVSIAVHYGGRS